MEGRTGEQKDGWSDSPYFIGPFRPSPGVQKLNQFIYSEYVYLQAINELKLSFVLGAILFDQSCNLIGCGRFETKLMNHILPRNIFSAKSRLWSIRLSKP